MSVSHRIKREVNDGAEVISETEIVTAGQAVAIDETFSATTANQLVAFAFTKTKLKSIFIVADEAMNLYTNAASSGSPQDHITLAADTPVQWTAADGASFIANPFAGNVTALYVTPSVADSTLRIRMVVDPT